MTRQLMPLAMAGLVASLVACAGNEPAATPAVQATPTAAAETQSEITIERDLPFATYKGTTLSLDLYLPADPSGAPIAIPPDGLADDLAREGAIAIGGENGVGIPDPADNDDQGPGTWRTTVPTFGPPPRRPPVRSATPGRERPSSATMTRPWPSTGSVNPAALRRT